MQTTISAKRAGESPRANIRIAAQQDDDSLAVAPVIDAIARSEIQPQLNHALAQRLGGAEVAGFKAPDVSVHPRGFLCGICAGFAKSFVGGMGGTFILTNVFRDEIMVGATGFEPATSWSQTKCSTRLSYAPRFCRPRLCAQGKSGQAISRKSFPAINLLY